MKWYIGAINFISLVYQLYVEAVQLFKSQEPKKLKRYFSDIKNVADLVQYMMTLSLLIISLTDHDWPSLETRRIIAAFIVFILWFKMFDWLRMFDATSFYIKLII